MRHKDKNSSTSRSTRGLLGPGADPAFASLADPGIRRRVLMAHLVTHSKQSVQRYVGRPLGRVLLRRWMRDKAASAYVESFGLPRHIVEEILGDEALTLHVDPRKLIRIAVHAPRHVEKRPSSLAFIWEGSWDQRREDLRVGTRYQLIRELDANRHQLERTERFQQLQARIDEGRPWASHQLGVLLDTPEKIRAYLQVYIDFLDDMAANGFDPGRGKDPIGVAISREGTILKVNRGLHRLAMAQHLGLPTVPVQVRHVHRLWWNTVTEGATGEAALRKMQQALQRCEPEEQPGPLDEDPEISLPDDFWPLPRTPMENRSK
ncbi:MAG: hypothetical protein GX772_10655 [Alcaligenaceae bacterium]|nr:hypothetical protein [Alcaligenaceae bacterium]